MKFNKLFLDETEDDKIKITMMSEIDKKNCLVIYCLSSIFELSNSSKESISLIESCFPMFADSNNFFELDFIFIKKILSRSGLNIDSELQVFNAADCWLSHDITQRSKYAKDLLFKVRLPILSIPALKKILNRVSSKYYECANTIKTFLVKKQQLHTFSCNITSRYCNNNNFKILVCGGQSDNSVKKLSDVKFFYANNFSEVIDLPNMNESRYYFAAVCIKGEFYVFGGINGNSKKIEKYSPDKNTWEFVTKMFDDRKDFFVCSLMDNIYVVGGCMGDVRFGNETASCLEFNTKSLEWKEMSEMNNARRGSACSVFEGRIVVSGGYYNGSLNTVEAYDHVGNTWENMPNMINERVRHKSVAVKTKLFVFCGRDTYKCEVFDSTTNKFTLLVQPTSASRFDFSDPPEVITIGSKIFVFQNDSSKVYSYDLEKNEWSVKPCEATKNIKYFSMLKFL